MKDKQKKFLISVGIGIIVVVLFVFLYVLPLFTHAFSTPGEGIAINESSSRDPYETWLISGTLIVFVVFSLMLFIVSTVLSYVLIGFLRNRLKKE